MSTEHNHEIKDSENGELFHPESDPRKLWNICPACKEEMIAWDVKVRQMIRENV